MSAAFSDTTEFVTCHDHGLVVDESSREVHLAGIIIELTRTEFDLLAILHRNPRRVLTGEILLSHLWQSDYVDSGHSIEVYIHRLRRKLGESGRNSHYIHTVRGVGYRFEPDSSDGGHVSLLYDAAGILRGIDPADALLWGQSTRQLIGTAFNPVQAVTQHLSGYSSSAGDLLWEIHVSRPKSSSM